MNYLITGNMKTLFFLGTLFFLSCGPEQGERKTYVYTVKNESGVPIKVLLYNSLGRGSDNPVSSITFENNSGSTKKYKDTLPLQRYSFSDFFATSNAKVVDSIRVIYNGVKQSAFSNKNRIGGERNPLNTFIYGSVEETFIFTKEDYENAEDCNGNCE